MAKEKKQMPTAYGGQAVMEGVMMRGKDSYCLAVRNPQGEIEKHVEGITRSSAGMFLSKIPLLRGMAALVSSTITGLKVLNLSAKISGFEEVEGPPSKVDLWLEKKFGENLTKYILALSVVLSLGISVLLFMALPTWISSFANPLLQGNLWALGIIEGIVRLCIFILYLLLMTKVKEVKRIFQYHGAEHKTINCYEKGEPLTTANVARHNRLHKRCGTSFLLFVMLISMIFFLFVQTDTIWLRVLSRILFVPFIAGTSYEVIKWAGISKSPIVAIISFPGLMLQKITTAEPDEKQIEVAIMALEGVFAAERGEEVVRIDDNRQLESHEQEPA